MEADQTSDEVAQAARELTEIMDELREAHGDPVAEYPSMTVFADTHGAEHSAISEHHNTQHGTDLSRSDVSEWMHEQARGVDHNWGVASPIVVLHD